MPTTYPGSFHDLSNPSPTTPTTDATVPHAQNHADANDLAEALQNKLGLGSSNQAPTANNLLRATGAGQTDYGKLFDAYVDAAAAIAYSKLNLAGQIKNTDVATAAAIAYSKLALTNSIVNGDVAAAANILVSKLYAGGATNLVCRTNDGANMLMGKLLKGDVSVGELPAYINSTGILASALGVASFTSIPTTFNQLLVVGLIRSTQTASSDGIYFRINSDFTANYWTQRATANSTGVNGDQQLGLTYGYPSDCPAASINAGHYSPFFIWFPGYRTSGAYKAWVCLSFYAAGISTGQLQARFSGGLWGGSVALTDMLVGCASGSIASGSIISLYGLP